MLVIKKLNKAQVKRLAKAFDADMSADELVETRAEGEHTYGELMLKTIDSWYVCRQTYRSLHGRPRRREEIMLIDDINDDSEWRICNEKWLAKLGITIPKAGR